MQSAHTVLGSLYDGRTLPTRSYVCIFTFTEVQLIHNADFASAVEQSEPVIHIHVSALFLRFRLHEGHHGALSRAPRAVQQVLTSYLFYIQWSVSVSPSLSIYP